MNVENFKQEVSVIENAEFKFKQLRNWISNSYDLYCKELELYYNEKEYSSYLSYSEDCIDFYASDEGAELIYQWQYLSYSDVNEIYRKMNWSVDEFKDLKPIFDNEIGCFYYDVTISSVFKKIETLENCVEYCYAYMELMNKIDERRMCYKYLVSTVREGIINIKLSECLDWIKNKKSKVFVAMSFAKEMQPARAKIIKAIEHSGYTPVLIDVKEHNGQIVPEIFKEIEESYFVVADLTGNRGGVYYEAGYAMAKNKSVILCCKNSKSKNSRPHFDVAQINTIFWNDEDDLYNRLIQRIVATIGKNF